MTTDAEHAAVLRRHMTALYFMKPDVRAAVERSIELLEREAATSEAQRVHRVWNAKYGWSAPLTNAPRSTSAPRVTE